MRGEDAPVCHLSIVSACFRLPHPCIRAFYSLATLAASSTHLIGAREFKGEIIAGKGYKVDERAPGNSRKSISVPAAHDIFLILERGKFTTIKKKSDKFT